MKDRYLLSEIMSLENCPFTHYGRILVSVKVRLYV